MAERSTSPNDSASAEEMLVGAELYVYLLSENDRQIHEAREKQANYQALKENLLDLVKRPRRQVMAPVAGGLAYFDTTLNSTNNILVLLGDGWFAERSASQAAEIAGRRVDFLKRELHVLQEERRSYESRREMFLSEMPDADAVMTKILETKARDMERVHQAALLTAAPTSASDTHSSTTASAAAGPASEGLSSRAAASAADDQSVCDMSSRTHESPESRTTAATSTVTAAATAPPTVQSTPPRQEVPARTEPSSETSGSVPALPEDLVALAAECGMSVEELKAISVIDTADDLTEEELIALEKELGDRVDDDAYVEEVMMARVVAKTEQRLRTTLQQRLASAPRTAPTVVEAEAHPSPRPFRSPADIGMFSTASASPPAAATAAESAVTSPKTEKRVRFAQSVDVREPSSPPSSTGAALTQNQPTHPASASPPSPHSTGRHTIAVGNIVEHQSGEHPALATAMSQQPHMSNKRKSLFMRGLDGDN